MSTAPDRIVPRAHPTTDASMGEYAERTLFVSNPPNESAAWDAHLQINPRATRPTPCVRRLELRLDLERIQQALYPRYALLALDRGLCVFESTASHGRLGLIHLHTTNDLRCALVYETILEIGADAGSATTPEQVIAQAIAASHPALESSTPNRLRIRWEQLFSNNFEKGWNLPIIETQGYAYILTRGADRIDGIQALPAPPWAREEPHDGDGSQVTTLLWTSTLPPHLPDRRTLESLDSRTEQSLQDYERGLPIASSLLSATTFGDTYGAELAMRIACIAAEQGDRSTLQTLYITQQRLWARGRHSRGTLSSLLTIHSALQLDTDASPWRDRLCTRVAQELDWEPIQEWLHAHLQRWQPKVLPTTRAQTSTPHPILQTSPNPSRVNSDSQDVQAHATRYLQRAMEAFEQDADETAWTLVTQGLLRDEPVSTEPAASMVLRLATKYADASMERAALRAIIEGAASEQHEVRATQLLAEHYDAHGELDQAIDLFIQGTARIPNSPLLCIAYAQLLSRNAHPNAVSAWDRVLELPQLEPWERAEYEQERKAAARWLRTQTKSAVADDAPASLSTHSQESPSLEDAIGALFLLSFGTARRTSHEVSSLADIEQALTKRPDAATRARLLAQRATLHLAQQAYERAAQSWTGALILTPDDPKVLAGIALTRTLQRAERDAEHARDRFIASYKNHAPDEAPAREALAVLRTYLR